MQQAHRVLLFFGAAVAAAGFPSAALGATYYVGPSGNDANSGLAYETPFATVTHALSLIDNAGGHTIYVLGGATYNLSSTISVSKTGVSGNMNRLWAYPGETPIFNFSMQPTGNSSRGFLFTDAANWWHVKGLTIEYAGDNGLNTEGDNGIFEQLITRYNEDSGLQLHGTATDNLVLNCDSYENFDPNNGGENADGFAAKFDGLGPGNIIRGSRAWANSDDGWDTWASANGVLVENSWSFDNGFDIWPGGSAFQGDGTGFKLGQDGGNHVLVNVLAIDNASNGIDVNGNGLGVKVFNSTSYSNSRNWQFDEDLATHILRNNISYAGTNPDNIYPLVTDSNNTWNGAAYAVSAADFVSTARVVSTVDLLKLPRQSDGSLPDLGSFLRLVSSSNLIDTGTPISFTFDGVAYNLPYYGSAPDLGAFEYAALPGDYNGDDVVNGADYTLWRDNLGTSATLQNDLTLGWVTEGDFNVWRQNFGDSLGSGAGGVGSAAVPEPASMVLLAVGAIIAASAGLRRQLRCLAA